MTQQKVEAELSEHGYMIC